MSPRAVVIGAGMSGLSSAVLLASHGYDVQVFEQHYRPGGMLHRFFRGGMPYETGFHYIGAMEHEQILGRCMAHLGVLDQLSLVPLDPDGFDELRFPDLRFRVPVGVEAYRARLKEHFPHQAAGIDGFLAEMAAAIEHYGLYRFQAEIDAPSLMHWEGRSVAQVLAQHISDERLRGVLTGQLALYAVPPQDAPFGLHAVILDHFLQGAWRLDGGGDALAGGLVERLRALGGALHLRSGVDKVIVRERTVAGVVLEDGTEVAADLVVSGVHPQVLMGMLPEGVVRKVYRKRIEGRRLGHSHFGMYLELDQPAAALAERNIYHLASYDTSLVTHDIRPEGPVCFFMSAPPAQRRGQRERHSLLFNCALGWDQVARWADSDPANRPASYLDYKASIEAAAIDGVLAELPELRGHISRVESSTPLSTHRYTRSPQGAMYGQYHGVAQMGRYRLPQVTRVRNLVLVGQGVFAPGVLGATLSAYYGVGYHLGLDKLLAELEAV